MLKNIPANRIAAGIAVLAGLLGALAPVIADLDLESVGGVIAGLTVIAATVDRFLKGSQQWERLQADTAHALGPVGDPGNEALVNDPAADDVPLDALPTDDEELASPPPGPAP